MVPEMFEKMLLKRCCLNTAQYISYVMVELLYGTVYNGILLTWFECFDSHRRGRVPQSLPYLSKLSVAQFPCELEARPLDLPLVAGRVREVGSGRLVDLDWNSGLFYTCG